MQNWWRSRWSIKNRVLGRTTFAKRFFLNGWDGFYEVRASVALTETPDAAKKDTAEFVSATWYQREKRQTRKIGGINSHRRYLAEEPETNSPYCTIGPQTGPEIGRVQGVPCGVQRPHPLRGATKGEEGMKRKRKEKYRNIASINQ